MQVIHTTKQPIQAQTDLVHLNQNLSYMAKDNKSLKLNEYDLITKTCLYNVDPRKPHFYMVKLGFTGVYIIRNMKKYQNFLSENFHFLVVKFSMYLNRHVFVM